MISNSDIQIWHDAVNGINESGQTDLTDQEWSALSVLNGCLSSGNLQSDESLNSYRVLSDNLNKHSNNPALYTHLQNFISLCNKYGMQHQIQEENLPNEEVAYEEDMIEILDLNTISRDDLYFLLSTAKDELAKYIRCHEKVERIEAEIEKKKKIISESYHGCLPIGIVVFIISFVVGGYLWFWGKDERTASTLFFVGVGALVFGPIISVSEKGKRDAAQRKIEAYQPLLANWQKKEEEAMNEFKFILSIPEDYCDEYALTTMLQYIENKRAISWERAVDLYEEHLHRMTMEDNARQTLEQAKLQAEYARQTRNASRAAAAGAWASAAGIWRINSKL